MGHLKAFVEHIRSVGTKHIMLITPPPVDEAVRVQENQQVRADSCVPIRERYRETDTSSRQLGLIRCIRCLHSIAAVVLSLLWLLEQRHSPQNRCDLMQKFSC